jgi:eukaryotic-like serine/threonine-protein kinase
MRDKNYGRLVAQRYQLLEIAGKGSMGHVYLARDTLLGGVKVAVKFLSRAKITDRVRERFVREATISALLGEKSIHIVKVRDYGVDDGEIPFYVMEFLQGESLRDIIHHKPMSLPRFFALVRQICLGLQCAHDGIEMDGNICQVIHRDIKPSNVMVSQDTTLGDFVKVLDFGIAFLPSEEAAGGFMGTPAYCSPEQMDGKSLDNRSDIYSLGIMMFQMLTGELPLKPKTSSFDGWYHSHHYQAPKTFQEISPDLGLPAAIEEFVQKCMDKDPNKRPNSVADIVKACEEIDQSLNEPSTVAIDSLPGVSTASPPSIERICLQSNWPEDKPRAEIVFPRAIQYDRQTIASVWSMLAEEELSFYLKEKAHCQFLFVADPHPMLLWITALYKDTLHYRLLPCYLDMKKAIGQQLIEQLVREREYRLLLFAIDGKSNCTEVQSVRVPSSKIKYLEQWLKESNDAPVTTNQKASKAFLKEEFEKLKPQILQGLARRQSRQDAANKEQEKSNA